ncbi:MAG: DUF2804 domain-containing protein [Sneathiella sp.]|nr:DUF2804 domain-containing protein [Sneathiella sp.]
MNTFIGPEKNVTFGHFNEPIGPVNYQDFALRNAVRDRLGANEIEKQFVHFHFLGLASQQFIAGCSLSYANQSTTVFFYLFDRKTGEILKRGCRIGENDIGNFSLNPDDGSTHLQGRALDVRFTFDPAHLKKEIEVSLDDIKVLHMTFQEKTPDFETLRLCTPTGPSGWTYCQKVAGLQAEGELFHNGQRYDLREIGAYAHHDFTAGFLRQDTFWNWACLTGQDDAGNVLGLNLSNGVNETGFSENVIWLNGKRENAGLISFDYDLDDLSKPWKISSESGRLNLTFRSEGQYAAQNKSCPLPFDFHQLFGSFEGTLRLESGDIIRINDIPGFCERQYAVWWK